MLAEVEGAEPGGSLEVPVELVEVEGAKPGGSLEVSVVFAEVEGAEPGGSLEVSAAFAEVERVEPGGASAKVIMSGGVCRGFSFGVQAMSSNGRSSI